MTSGSNESPRTAAGPDLILLALFQSRLRERSLDLDRVIQSDAPLPSIRRAEAALAAVQAAERRLGHGRYGLCDTCHEPIGWDELLQSPEQTSCRSCSQFSGLDELKEN